ncbi:MAG: 4-hydroxy-tetrahydrodipicolinate reductase [Eubacteriales bacterium]|nr:4-hydroxy-tetrahydrodipicolinate reductase [Eubacteriales bacterium]
MTRIIITGCNGYMGQFLTDLIAADKDAEVVAGIDIANTKERPYPVFATPAECNVEADVVIDFSHFSAVDALLDFCEEKKLPLVLCTTALKEETLVHVAEASRQTAILRSANMSLGINLFMKMLKEAASKLAPAGYDIEIVEAHHNRKIDAPSGTAIALGESINDALDNEYHFVFNRSDRHEKRDPKEIGISAIRGGSIVGDHEIMFCGQDEVITFRHTAYSRAIFGKGAIEAAKYLSGKPAGMYDMSDVIG